MAKDEATPPVEEDIRYDDENFNPLLEPKKANAWLNLLTESEKAFEDYNSHGDKIDRMYASLGRLSDMSRDKQFQMFWANAEVLRPSIYAKKPQPVVVPKFKDRRPVYQAASEFLERCATVAFDLAEINDLMLLVRDDLALLDRGVAWCRYESGKGDSYYDHEKVCIDFKNRRDFLHSISRNWREVTWVAGASYLTRGEARKRFRKYSGDEYQRAEYRVNKDAEEIGGADNRERAKFWEIWDKKSNRVVWVSPGCKNILDEDKPHLKLRNFFPCPKPAYGTVQRGSLVPVPDVLQYKDQLEELNLLTGRIHALSDAIEAKGFYPAGSDAVQRALTIKTPGRVLVPISNWAAFGGTKDVIIWLPIDMIATTITGLVALRKEIINDIYQIMGLSDIMRGATDPNETLGAQQLKTQYGSTRIRDKQQELVRLARDLVEITTEIITSEFDPVTMIEMSQTELPTQAMQQEKIDQLQQQTMSQLQQMAQTPQAQQMMQQNPQMVQQIVQKAKQQVDEQTAKIKAEPTIEQVLHFVKDARAKAFTLDIETDSTIEIDENADKQRRAEFVGVLSQLLPQIASMVGAVPETAQFGSELLKFAVAPYRAGRALDGSIDQLADIMQSRGDRPQQENPETVKTKALVSIEQQKLQQQKDKDKAELDLKKQDLDQKAAHEAAKLQNNIALKQMELSAKRGDNEAKSVQASQKIAHDREAHQMDMVESAQDMRLNQQKMAMAQQQQTLRANDVAQKAADRRAQQQFRETQALMPPRTRQ
jgi:hypothetical protein